MSFVELDNVHSSLGYIVRTRTEVEDGSNLSVLTVVIKPHLDLTTSHDLQIDMYSGPALSSKGGVIVRLVDADHRRYFHEEQMLSRGEQVELDLPWLKKYRYPLAVWFFAVRLLLKRPTLDAWRGSVMTNDFWHVPASSPASWYQSQLSLIPGVGRSQGRRKYMEDIEIIYEQVRYEQSTFAVFGVLDGHGGEDCAHHAADDIPMKIAANMRRGLSCPDALFKSFKDTDEEYLSTSNGASSGSTANVILYDRSHSVLYIANTGDTRAVLSRDSQGMELSYDRKASDPEEIARIAMAGGFVVNGRVSGSLAVARAIGDAQFKYPQRGILVPDPEITFFAPCKGDQFVIIATDGLWDVMSSQDAVNFAKSGLEKEGIVFNQDSDSSLGAAPEEVKPKLSKVATDLVNHAINNLGSQDNVTVMILLICGASLSYSAMKDYIADSAAQMRTGSHVPGKPFVCTHCFPALTLYYSY